MKRSKQTIFLCAVLLLQMLLPNLIFGQSFPLKKSSNGRYLVDQDGKPFLINGDTGWLLVKNLTLSEVEVYLDNRKAKKFNTIQLLLTTFFIEETNRAGVKPFVNASNFSIRNEGYFNFVGQILEAARVRGIAAIIVPIWQGAPNAENLSWRPTLEANGEARNKEFGNYLGTKFNRSAYPNIIAWMMGGDNIIDYTYPYYKAMATGIREKDAGVFLTYHMRGRVSTDDITDTWLNFNSIYSYDPDHNGCCKVHVYDLAYRAYNHSSGMPFYLSESSYEGAEGPAYIRRQAYWPILSGAAGHIYGATNVMLLPSVWKDNLNLPGTIDITYLYNFFDSFEWSKLVPDRSHTLVTAGFGTFNGTSSAGDDYVTAALTTDGKVGVAYLPPTGTGTRTLTVAMGQLTGSVTAKWYNPNTGVYTTISGSPFANSGSRNFTTPGNNGDNANDWVLFLDARPTTPVVNSYIRLEAESATESAPLVEGTDANASGGKFVWNPSGAVNNTAVARASYTFNVTNAGTYKVWGRAITPAGGDSFWVKMDGGSWVKWNGITGATATAWGWDDVHDTDNAGAVMTYTLSAGSHTLQLSEREAGCRLDKWVITNDMAYTPSGLESGVTPTYLYLEAESATESTPLVEGNDANASGGKFVSNPSGAVNNTSVARASYTFNITTAGTYKVWGRVMTPPAGDSFWVKMDSGSWIMWNGITGATATAWGWDDVHNTDNAGAVMTYTLSAGSHTLHLSEREAGTKLDRWLITNDLSYTPTGISSSANPSSANVSLGGGEVKEAGFKMYPNPATDAIAIETSFETGTVSIVSASGQKVFKGKMAGTLNRIDVSSLSPGLYIVIVVGDNRTTTRKLQIVK